MNVYQGHNRRQTGGSIWFTIQRGAKPFIMSMLSKLKPHAMNVGKKVASSALNAGTNLTLDALSGKLNKQSLKDTITNEVDKLKSEAHKKFLVINESILIKKVVVIINVDEFQNQKLIKCINEKHPKVKKSINKIEKVREEQRKSLQKVLLNERELYLKKQLKIYLVSQHDDR